MRVAVVQQFYETRVIDEFVLRGNTATLKCLVPSFVADFVDVIEWLAVEDGSTYSANSQEEKGTSSLSLSLSSRLLEKIFSETAMSTWASFPSLPPPPSLPSPIDQSNNRSVPQIERPGNGKRGVNFLIYPRFPSIGQFSPKERRRNRPNSILVSHENIQRAYKQLDLTA